MSNFNTVSGVSGTQNSSIIKRKRPFKPKKKVSLTADVQHLKLDVKKLKAAPEIKYSDTLTLGSIPGAGGAGQGLLHLCNNVLVGGLPYQRVGSEVLNTYLEARVSMYTGTANATDFPLQTRMLIFWDKQPNGNAPFLYTSGTGSGVDGLIDNTVITPITCAPLNQNAMKRFKVLVDEFRMIEPHGPSSYGLDCRTYKIPLFRKTRYTGTLGTGATGTIADLITNALWFVFFQDSGVNNAGAECGSRVYYQDS